MLLKKDFEGVRSAILIQERHIRGNIDPKNRLLGVKFAKVVPANEDHVSEWSFQFAHFPDPPFPVVPMVIGGRYRPVWN
jgi:hypothetical protein